MSRVFPILVLGLLGAMLAVASVGAAIAQTATPTPKPLLPAPTKAPVATIVPTAPTTPADYEAQALEQLGNLRAVASDLYLVSGVLTDTVDSAISILTNELRPFASDVTPPADFAPFHVRLYMALRPCLMAVALIQRGGDDVFTAMIVSSYTQSCYTAAADASVEWARVTGEAPIFLVK